jgi:hypothetical protein
MLMTAGVRKLALTTHVTSSVGWLGSVAAFLALAIAGVSSGDSQMVRAAYLAMHLTIWFVIVPLSVASLLTGLVDALGTPWGLVRHYWVVTKLLLTVSATTILLVHTQSIDHVAEAASRMDLAASDLRHLRLQLVGDAAAALFVLCATTTLSVYKPWGMTPYGSRMQSETTTSWRPADRRPRLAGRYVIMGIVGFVLLILALHLFGVGLHGH